MSRLSIFLKSVGFNIPVMIFVILFLIIFYKKKKEQKEEKPLFEFLLQGITIPLFVEFVALAMCIWLPEKSNVELKYTLFRVFYFFAYFWFLVFMIYQIAIVFKQILEDKEKPLAKKIVGISGKLLSKEGKKERFVLYSVALIEAFLAATIGKFELIFIESGPVVVAVGQLTNILVYMYLALSFIIYGIMVANRNKIKNLQVAPFYVITGIYCVAVAVSVFLGWHTNSVVSFFGFLMTIIFFTIESQDTEILETYNITKENEKKTIESKQKILVNMSHEIRSPMHNILGYGNIIKDVENMSEEEFKSNMGNITNSVYDLKDMIENIHDIANIESNQVSVNQVQYESKNLYSKINSFGERKSNKDGLRFTFEFDQMLPNIVYGDYDKIYKIITKVLENSIENTNYGEVKLSINGKMLDAEFIEMTYKVANTGHVMTKEMFDMNYEEFMLSGENINHVKLGIIIAKKYIEMLGGEIEFINEPGQGTQYIVTFRQKVIGAAPIGSLNQN